MNHAPIRRLLARDAPSYLTSMRQMVWDRLMALMHWEDAHCGRVRPHSRPLVIARDELAQRVRTLRRMMPRRTK